MFNASDFEKLQSLLSSGEKDNIDDNIDENIVHPGQFGQQIVQEKEEEVSDNDLSDDNNYIVPEYDSIYRQHVSAEDIYMPTGLKDITNSDAIIYTIKLSVV